MLYKELQSAQMEEVGKNGQSNTTQLSPSRLLVMSLL